MEQTDERRRADGNQGRRRPLDADDNDDCDGIGRRRVPGVYVRRCLDRPDGPGNLPSIAVGRPRINVTSISIVYWRCDFVATIVDALSVTYGKTRSLKHSG